MLYRRRRCDSDEREDADGDGRNIDSDGMEDDLGSKDDDGNSKRVVAVAVIDEDISTETESKQWKLYSRQLAG